MLGSKSNLNYYPEPEYELEEKPESSRKKPNRKKRRKNNSSMKLIYILIAIMFLGACLFLLSGYAKLTSVRTDITNLENEQIELEKIKVNLIAELEVIKSSSKIAEDATYKLGMGYPSEGQIAYVSVNEANLNENIDKFSIKEQIDKLFSKVGSLF